MKKFDDPFERFLENVRGASRGEVIFAAVFSASALAILYFAVPEMAHRLAQAFR